MGRDGEGEKHYKKNCIKNSKNNGTVLKSEIFLAMYNYCF